MNITVDFEAYLRYSRGESSPEETQVVRQWLAQPANGLLAHYWMSQFAEMLEQEGKATADPAALERMESRLFPQLGFENEPRLIPALAPAARFSWPRLAAAAALALAVAGGGWLWQHGPGQTPALRQAAANSFATAYGETRTVQLPDGSEVKLNSHSTLRYAGNLLDGKAREVWLDGEGYFSIKHLPDNRRFVVHTTAGLNVEVLGTKFTVFRRRAQARVVLLSGKVRVAFADSSWQKPIILKPGELLETQDAQPQKIVHKAVRVARYAAWKDDKLVFDETPVAEVAAQLSDTYGVRVVVATPALNHRTVTGTFPAKELDTVLQVLEKSFKLTIRRQPNQIVLSE
jgi:transmembrane sensor